MPVATVPCSVRTAVRTAERPSIRGVQPGDRRDGRGCGPDTLATKRFAVVELTGGEPLENGEAQRVFTLVTKGLGGVAVLRKAHRVDPDEARVVRRLELRLQNAAISLLDRVRGEIKSTALGAQS